MFYVKALGYAMGTIALVLLDLITADAVYTSGASAKQCDDYPAQGTMITIPGESMKVLSTDPEQQLVLDVVRDPFDIPNYKLVPEHGHIHPQQAEGFEVIEGRAQVLVGEEIHTLAPGDSLLVPPNTIHHWMALDDQPVRVLATFDPPMRVASWFVHFQKHIANDSMDFFQAAVISREFPNSSPAPVSPSPAIWSVLSRIMAPIGRLMGYKPCG